MVTNAIKQGVTVVIVALLTGCASKKATVNPSISGDSSQSYAVDAQPQFSEELARGPHQGLLNQRRFYFAFDSHSLKSKYLAVIKAHANYLRHHPNQKVLLAGNTDSRGSREYNLILGEKRADVVAKTLEKYGVKQSQVRTISYGEERPIFLGHSSEDYAKNRRTDLIYE